MRDKDAIGEVGVAAAEFAIRAPSSSSEVMG
jgi:hypothetical protein